MNFIKEYKKHDLDVGVKHYDDGLEVTRKYQSVENENYFSFISVKVIKGQVVGRVYRAKNSNPIIIDGRGSRISLMVKIPKVKIQPVDFDFDKNDNIKVIDNKIKINNNLISINNFMDVLYENHVDYMPNDIFIKIREYFYDYFLKIYFWLAGVKYNFVEVSLKYQGFLEPFPLSKEFKVVEKPGDNDNFFKLFKIYKNIMFIAVLLFLIVGFILDKYNIIDINNINLSSLSVIAILFLILYFLEKISKRMHNNIENEADFIKKIHICKEYRVQKIKLFKSFKYYKK